jgi:hypothetical protein
MTRGSLANFSWVRKKHCVPGCGWTGANSRLRKLKAVLRATEESTLTFGRLGSRTRHSKKQRLAFAKSGCSDATLWRPRNFRGDYVGLGLPPFGFGEGLLDNVHQLIMQAAVGCQDCTR